MPDIILGDFSTDITPPNVTNPYPDNGLIDQNKNTNIEFDITDTESGVDINSIVVYIEGILAFSTGSFQNGYTGSLTDVGGGTWHVVLITPSSYDSYAIINITVDAQDQAIPANVMAQYSWSFKIEDYEPPYILNNVPTGINQPINVFVEFDLLDDGAGVDLPSVVVTIGGVVAYFNSTFQPGFQGVFSIVTGSPSNYHFRIDSDPNYSGWTTYLVEVEADDLAPA